MAEIKTSVTTLPENRVQLNVEVPAEEVSTQVDKIIRQLSRDAKMPGFRKGKVPRNLIMQRFGKDAILAQTLEDALPAWLQSAIDESRIKPVDQPEIELEDAKVELDDLLGGKPFVFEATVPVMPRPQVGKYTGIEVEKDVVSISDADVNEQVDLLRRRLGRLDEVKQKRAAKDSDYVLIDFAGYVDGEQLEGGTGKDYMLELGSKQFIPGFEEQITGMKKGQSKKLKLTFPEDYRPQHLAGKEVEFDVTLKEIKERILPESDDAFAAENTEFDTIAEFKADVRSRLQKAREEEAEALFQQKAVEKVVSEAQLEVPPKAIDARARELEMNFVSSLQARGVGADEYLKMNDEEKQKFSEHFRVQAEEALRSEAVLETVADIEGIEVSDEEVDEEIRKAAPRMGKDPEELIKEMRERRRAGIVRDDLIHRKVAGHISEHAIPVLKKAGAARAAEKEKEPAAESKIIRP